MLKMQNGKVLVLDKCRNEYINIIKNLEIKSNLGDMFNKSLQTYIINQNVLFSPILLGATEITAYLIFFK